MKIVKAEHIGDYKVKLFFSDKKQRTVDFGEFIFSSTHPSFTQYKDLKKFRKFKLEHGNIVWGKDWDLIFPLEQLHNGRIKLPKKYRTADTVSSIAAEPPTHYGKR